MTNTIDEKLEDLINESHGNIWEDYQRKIENPALAEAKASLIDYIESEIIGEDELLW